MNNWQKHRNFRRLKNVDGTYTCTITVDGIKVEVSQQVYKAYAEGGYKMEHLENDIKNSRVLQDSVTGNAVRDEHGNAVMLPEREISLDKLISEDWDFASAKPSPESIVTDMIQNEELHCCLDRLNPDERVLIDALFFGGMTEREYSAKTGIPQKTINDRKFKVLEKLKKLLEK